MRNPQSLNENKYYFTKSEILRYTPLTFFRNIRETKREGKGLVKAIKNAWKIDIKIEGDILYCLSGHILKFLDSGD